MSGGQQQMVAIMRGLASDPKILAVDEPCLGLAEAMSRRVYDALARIHQAGTTLIVVEEVRKLLKVRTGDQPDAQPAPAGAAA